MGLKESPMTPVTTLGRHVLKRIEAPRDEALGATVEVLREGVRDADAFLREAFKCFKWL